MRNKSRKFNKRALSGRGKNFPNRPSAKIVGSKPQYPGKPQELSPCLEEERLLTEVHEGMTLESWIIELKEHIKRYGGAANYPAGKCFGTPPGTSLTRNGCGDMNGDGGLNVLDVVALVNCVVSEGDCGCAGDLNGDGGHNVLDVVALVNCVLVDSSNCGDSCCPDDDWPSPQQGLGRITWPYWGCIDSVTGNPDPNGTDCEWACCAGRGLCHNIAAEYCSNPDLYKNTSWTPGKYCNYSCNYDDVDDYGLCDCNNNPSVSCNDAQGSYSETGCGPQGTNPCPGPSGGNRTCCESSTCSNDADCAGMGLGGDYYPNCTLPPSTFNDFVQGSMCNNQPAYSFDYYYFYCMSAMNIDDLGTGTCSNYPWDTAQSCMNECAMHGGGCVTYREGYNNNGYGTCLCAIGDIGIYDIGEASPFWLDSFAATVVGRRGKLLQKGGGTKFVSKRGKRATPGKIPIRKQNKLKTPIGPSLSQQNTVRPLPALEVTDWTINAQGIVNCCVGWGGSVISGNGGTCFQGSSEVSCNTFNGNYCLCDVGGGEWNCWMGPYTDQGGQFWPDGDGSFPHWPATSSNSCYDFLTGGAGGDDWPFPNQSLGRVTFPFWGCINGSGDPDPDGSDCEWACCAGRGLCHNIAAEHCSNPDLYKNTSWTPGMHCKDNCDFQTIGGAGTCDCNNNPSCDGTYIGDASPPSQAYNRTCCEGSTCSKLSSCGANGDDPGMGLYGDMYPNCTASDNCNDQDINGNGYSCDGLWASTPGYSHGYTCGYISALGYNCSGCDCPDPRYGSCGFAQIKRCPDGVCLPNSADHSYIGDGACNGANALNCYGIDMELASQVGWGYSTMTFIITETANGCWQDGAIQPELCTAAEGGDCARTGGKFQSGGRMNSSDVEGPPLPTSLDPKVVKQTVLGYFNGMRGGGRTRPAPRGRGRKMNRGGIPTKLAPRSIKDTNHIARFSQSCKNRTGQIDCNGACVWDFNNSMCINK